MNNLALKRILSQKIHSNVKPTVIHTEPIRETKNYLELDILRKKLMEEIAPTPIPEAEGDSADVKIQIFDGIENFVAWYREHIEKFNEVQRKVLSTLLQAKEMINKGCKCKEPQRRAQAQDYYKMFWLGNSNNDLPTTVMSVGGFDSVDFRADGVSFLRFPLKKI